MSTVLCKAPERAPAIADVQVRERSSLLAQSPAFPAMTIARLSSLRSVLGLACLVIGSGLAFAEPGKLRAVATAPEHDPLFIDESSIKRSGPIVTFRYVLNVPVAFEAPAASRRWRSNEMGAVLDCRARTYVIADVVAHSGPGATGNIVGRHSATAAERIPAPIVATSTFDYLARQVCGTASR
jgi:hypothetical protein